MAVRLINPRGRVVTVEPDDVTELLKRGFMYVPPDQKEMYYNQVFDKGSGWKEPYVERSKNILVKTPTLGDVLNVELV